MSQYEIPQSLNEVSPRWVKMALLGSGVPNAVLPPFQLIPLGAENSMVARLIFEYLPEGRHLPKSLIFKLCPNGHEFLGASEPNYYVRDYVDLINSPIAKCFGSVGACSGTSESVGNGYALFLEDLSTDYNDNKQIEPNETHAANLGNALGKLHSFRWGPDADPEGQHNLDADFQRFLKHVESGLEPIIESLGNTLSAPSRSRLIRVFSNDADRMRRRAMDGNSLTLVHGDPNPTNVLSCGTTSSDRSPIYLIDRQPFEWSLRLWLGASDLVYAAIPFWSVRNRRALQHILLISYHTTLLDYGVKDYSWEDLLEDWNICICIAVFTAIEWGSDPASLDKMKWLWQRQLQKALIALNDCESSS